ncbi:MAG: urease accessory protein UreE [Rhodospirillales bacterium]|nr:urease accessory protein UreE [Rhodospirillales bacterium]
MRSAKMTKVIGSFLPDAVQESVTLDFDDRFRRRKVFRTDSGAEFLLDLPEAQVLRDGDALPLSDGSLVLVRAAPEPLLEIQAETPEHLLRLAWHLGNRHLPADLQGGKILIRFDHVIERMLIGLGARLAKVQAPFNPEGGAYGEHNRNPDHKHGHHHGDGHHHHHD